VAATRIPLDYACGGRDERVMQLILDEIGSAPRLDLHISLPRDPRLMRVCETIIADPAAPATLERLAEQIHVSTRTLARMFHRELDMSFGDWLRRTRLLLSLPRLVAGASVLEVALEHGYDSPSAFTAMFRRILGSRQAPTSSARTARALCRNACHCDVLRRCCCCLATNAAGPVNVLIADGGRGGYLR
jgi:transcriptional regulator GlxA family with amidase domain